MVDTPERSRAVWTVRARDLVGLQVGVCARQVGCQKPLVLTQFAEALIHMLILRLRVRFQGRLSDEREQIRTSRLVAFGCT